MIHGVYANQPSFRSVEFGPGLNIVLAEREEGSSQKDTRNGVGKSTLIQIIDFCLGARATRGKGLCIPELGGWEFTIDTTIQGNRVRVTRSTDESNRIVIEGRTDGWIRQPGFDVESQQHVLNLQDWRTVLGAALFGLSPADLQKYAPSYRSLVSYFVRRGADAYTDPFRHFRNQATWDIQVHCAFLLGLDWRHASKWQDLRDQEEAIKAVQKAIKSGAIEGAIGSLGELEAERVRLEAAVDSERESLTTFRVHPQYERLQEEADRLTQEIHELANSNVSDRRKLRRYQESISEETPPADAHLETVYQEAGVLFANSVKHALGEAREFHHQLIENRRTFLESEMGRLERGIADREARMASLTLERSELLEVLQTHGAFEEFSRLQERHVASREKLEQVRTRIQDVRSMSNKKRDLKIGKQQLAKTAETDYEERRELWTPAVQAFNENSQALYNSPGRLLIDITDSGYRLDVVIERSDSEGIGRMKMFCFDLMLTTLMRRRNEGIDFLIHDSVIFDGVDSRQRALAIERAETVTSENCCQYICAVNSDMVPFHDFSPDFDFDSFVRIRLTDREPSESLLGFRF